MGRIFNIPVVLYEAERGDKLKFLLIAFFAFSVLCMSYVSIQALREEYRLEYAIDDGKAGSMKVASPAKRSPARRTGHSPEPSF